MQRLFPILLVSSFMLCAKTLFAQWQTLKDEDGIKVEANFKDNNLLEMRATMIADVNMHALIKMQLEAENTPKWVYRVTHGETVRVVNDRERFTYFKMDMPWPIADRDLSMHTTMRYDANAKVAKVHSKVAPNNVPLNPDYERITTAESLWTFKSLGPNKTEVTRWSLSDTNGFPKWLVKIFAGDAPYEDFQKMVDRAKQSAYQGAEVAWIGR